MNTGRAFWKRLPRRLLTMGRAEISDRIRQQAAARLDFLRYKAGAEFAPAMRSPMSAAQPQFFFSSDAVPAICSKLHQLFPETVEQIVERAKRICQHRFDLLGYDAVDYGPEIDWHCDRVNGKRAPRKPWYQIKYLDFAEVGDSKVTWELSRHQHLVTLAKAYRLSGDDRFATELFRQWHHWHGENPHPVGINWASSLEVSFRSLSWLWMYFLLAESPAMPPGFRNAWLRALAVSGHHIDCHLSTYFSPNTHLLGEAVALFFIGTLCPEIPASQTWQQRGWKIVQQEAVRQVRSDGLHFEQSTYYHVYALDFFLHSAVLASVNRLEVPKEFDRTVERMIEALAVLGRSGCVPRLGDDDGGRLFDAARNRASDLLDPLAAGAVLFGRGDFKALAGGHREEMLWLLGEAGLEEFNRIPDKVSDSSTAFQDSGLFVMTGSNHEWQIVVDAGPLGADSAGHGHADALSITASASDGNLLIDSGTFQYVGSGSERDSFRGTRAHNTLMVGREDQAEPAGPFAWERLPNVEAEGWIAGKTFDLFVGSHDGYSRLPNPVVHRRFVFALKPGLCLVRDLAIGFGEYPLDIYWHLDPELRQSGTEADCFVAGKRGLRFLTVKEDGWSQTVEEHAHSPVYGKKETHSVLHLSCTARLPAEFLTLITLALNMSGPQPSLTRMASPEARSQVEGYGNRNGEDEHGIFFGRGGAWKLESWSSDAEFLYAARKCEGTEPLLICCNATFVEWEQRRIMTAKRPVLRCEIIGAEPVEVTSSDAESVTVDREAWKLLSSSPQLAVKTT